MDTATETRPATDAERLQAVKHWRKKHWRQIVGPPPTSRNKQPFNPVIRELTNVVKPE